MERRRAGALTNAHDSATTAPPVRSHRLAVLLAVLVAVAAVATSACDKPNDLPRMQDEIAASAASYRSRFDELRRRADAVEPRLRALPQDTGAAGAQHLLGVARTTIDQGLGHLQQLPTLLPDWLQAKNAPALLRAWLADKRRELEDGVTEASAAITAVESWAAVAEQRTGAPEPPAAAPAPAEPVPGAPPPPPTADDREPAADGSGAPIR